MGYRSVANPRLLGGPHDMRKLILDPVHLKQENKSQNAALWSFYPVEQDFDMPYGDEVLNGLGYESNLQG